MVLAQVMVYKAGTLQFCLDALCVCKPETLSETTTSDPSVQK